MALLTALAGAKETILLVGFIAGAGITLDHMHAPASAVSDIQTDLRVDRIRAMVKDAASDGANGYICDAIEAELINLCTDKPDHYLCRQKTIDELKAKAGC